MSTSPIDKYNAEIEEELDLNDFNVKDIQMRLPGMKHKWVARLIQWKIELKKLEHLKKEAINTVANNIREKSVINISDAAINRQAQHQDVVKKIINEIEKAETVIEFLEKIEKIYSSVSFDIKNIIEIRKLELT